MLSSDEEEVEKDGRSQHHGISRSQSAAESKDELAALKGAETEKRGTHPVCDQRQEVLLWDQLYNVTSGPETRTEMAHECFCADVSYGLCSFFAGNTYLLAILNGENGSRHECLMCSVKYFTMYSMMFSAGP